MSELLKITDTHNHVRRELSALLARFSTARSMIEIASSVAGAISSLLNARSVCLATFLNGTDPEGKIFIGSYGYSDFLNDHAGYKSMHKDGTIAKFMQFVNSFNNQTSDAGFTFVNSNGSKFYCRKVQDTFELFNGFIGIESDLDPFSGSSFDSSLMVLTLGALRLTQAENEIGAQAAVMHRIAHDLNGSLAIIGLQLELLRLSENHDSPKQEAVNRISSAMKKADSSINQLNEFSHLFFSENRHAIEPMRLTSPSIALRVALKSLNISEERLAMIKIAVGIEDSDQIEIEGVVLYWIYRALIATWLNPHIWGAKDTFGFQVTLQTSGSDSQFIDLAMSRSFGIEIDRFLDASRKNGFGMINQVIHLMPPPSLLESLLPFFGGSGLIKTENGIRTAIIRFPRIQV